MTVAERVWGNEGLTSKITHRIKQPETRGSEFLAPPQLTHCYNVWNTSQAASTVAAMIEVLCSVEVNPASNCEGAR